MEKDPLTDDSESKLSEALQSLKERGRWLTHYRIHRRWTTKAMKKMMMKIETSELHKRTRSEIRP